MSDEDEAACAIKALNDQGYEASLARVSNFHNFFLVNSVQYLVMS